MSDVVPTPMTFPLVRELTGQLSTQTAFRRLAGQPHCVFLDSSLRDARLGRYSFLMADPYDTVVINDELDSLDAIRRRVASLHSNVRDDLPPFQGGLAGIFTYEFGRCFESLPPVGLDEFNLPLAFLGLFDVVVAFDHVAEKSWIISQGFPEIDEVPRYQRAQERLEQFTSWLSQPDRDFSQPGRPDAIDIKSNHVLIKPSLDVYSNFTRDTYCQMVNRAIEYIFDGDAFQVNLAQRLLKPISQSSVELYCRLRSQTKATFGGYFDAGDWQVMSASPERFVRSYAGRIEARPIKGTRARLQRPVADVWTSGELISSEKDRAENTMIVDLLRNDLSRVCEEQSVHVPKWCGLESYGYVSHLVSVVNGVLRSDADAFDVLQATFPGGSITGAPKVRAMEIISELELVARGPYCGSMGYIGWDGSMDLSILIRTITAAGGWWQFPVGGGIVAQSNPTSEYDETWDKAQGVLAAFAGTIRNR